MRWALVVVVVLAAVIAVNAALLSYGGDRHDPVGRLSPVAAIPVQKAKTPPPPPTTSRHRHHQEDD